MANLQKFFGGRRKFFIILLFAAAIGLIHGAHNFLIPRELKKIAPDFVYYPMTVASNYDVGTFYAARVKAAAARGQFFSGDVNLAEYPKIPSSVPFLPSVLMGITAKVLGSVERAIIFSDFFFSALAFFIIFLLLFVITSNFQVSLLGGTFLIFEPGFAVLITSPALFGWHELAVRLMPVFDFKNTLPYLRFDYPKLTELFYAAALMLLYLNLRKPGNKWLIYSGAASLGTLLYIYLYDGLYLFAAVGFLLVGLLAAGERVRAKTLAIILFLALIISAPYWWNYLRLHALPQYNEILWRLGVEVSNSIRWSSWTSALRVVVLSVLVWIFFRKKDKVMATYLIALLVPIIFVLNLQVVTGMNPAPDHWHRAQFLPVAIVLFLFASTVWSAAILSFGKYFRILKNAPVILSAVILAMHIFGQTVFSAKAEIVSNYAIPLSTVRSYQWLDENIPEGSVVGSLSADTDAELAMYTRSFIYLPRAFNTVAGTEELWLRAVILSRILKLSSDEFRGLFGHDSPLTSFLFGDLYRSREINSIFEARSRDVPKEVLEDKIAVFQNGNIPFSYKLDYLYVGPRELDLYKNQPPDFNALYGRPVYDKEGVRIYKLAK